MKKKTVRWIKKNIIQITEWRRHKRRERRNYLVYTNFLHRTDEGCKKECPVYKRCQEFQKSRIGTLHYCNQVYEDPDIGDWLKDNVEYFMPIYREDSIYEKAEEVF